MARRRRTPAAPRPYVLRRRWRRRLVAVLSLLLLVALVLADRQGLLLAPGDDLTRYQGRPFVVSRVVDGDTLVIDVPDTGEPATRIRLWGVDTPERARSDLNVPAEPFAEEATALAQTLATSGPVTLELEPHRLRDRYGRLLAHVRLADGSLLAERLLLAGLAKADDRWPHSRRERFTMLELQARRERLGLWAQRRDDRSR